MEDKVKKSPTTLAEAQLYADKAAALAREKDARAIAGHIFLNWKMKAVVSFGEIARRNGNRKAIADELIRFGFTVSELPGKRAYTIGVLDQIKEVVLEGKIPTSGESEAEVREKYPVAVAACERANEVIKLDESSVEFSAAAFVLGLRPDVLEVTYSVSELVEKYEIGSADLQRILDKIGEMGIKIEALEGMDTAYTGLATPGGADFYIFRWENIEALRKAQTAAIEKCFPDLVSSDDDIGDE